MPAKQLIPAARTQPTNGANTRKFAIPAIDQVTASALDWLPHWLDSGPLATVVGSLGRAIRPTRGRTRRKTFDDLANTICDAIAMDRRFPNEMRLARLSGGRFVVDILGQQCLQDGQTLPPLGVAERARQRLHRQIEMVQIAEEELCRAIIEVEYSVAQRNYLQSGRVWEMQCSVTSEIADAAGRMFAGASAPFTASIPYGVGAAMLNW